MRADTAAFLCNTAKSQFMLKMLLLLPVSKFRFESKAGKQELDKWQEDTHKTLKTVDARLGFETCLT